MIEIVEKVEAIELRVQHVEKQLADNAALLRDIHGWIEKGRGFFAVCGWLASAFKWIVGLAVPLAAAWALFNGRNGGGGPP